MGVLGGSGDPTGLDGDPRGVSAPCFWLFLMEEMLEHLRTWLDVSAGAWLLPGQGLSSVLVFGVVMGGVLGFSHAGIWNQAGLGCKERAVGWWKLSPFSSAFKPFLKSKPARAHVCGAGAVPVELEGAPNLPSHELPTAA